MPESEQQPNNLPLITDAEKVRALPLVLMSGSLNAMFCALTVFGSVFVLFLDELGLPKTRIGVVQSFLPFTGIVAIFLARWAAHVGYKRVFLFFYSLRKLIVSLMLLTPWVLREYGQNAAFLWVSGVFFLFSLSRAISETAMFPWLQELIPNRIRGKFDATANIVGKILTMSAVAVAGIVIGDSPELSSFMLLLTIGTAIGIASAVMRFFLPGGAPVPREDGEKPRFRTMFEPLKDSNFRYYLIAMAFGAFGITPFGSFVPLFMKEVVGITAGNIVMLEIGASAGSLASGFLWGWTADRYGSKPVWLSGLGITMLLPVCWMIMPRHHVLSYPIAIVISVLGGAGTTAWFMGYMRYLFVNAVPEQKKTEYMAVYYSWLGVTMGLAPLYAGRLLDFTHGLAGSVGFVSIDAYTPLFLLSLVFLTGAGLIIRRVKGDGALPLRHFVGLFLEGNPFSAFGGILRYRMAREESQRVFTTQRMGDTGNPLTITELLEALEDPGFNVRYEAIISLARMKPRREVVDALVDVLEHGEPGLSIAAAWALGKLGHRRAIRALRTTLGSGYPLLQARSARALAALGDRDSIPIFFGHLRSPENDMLRIAYASALGTLGETRAVGELLDFLATAREEAIREELALAVARILGSEGDYIRLWRGVRGDFPTAVARAVSELRKNAGPDLAGTVEECFHAYARNRADEGNRLLAAIIDGLPAERFDDVSAQILAWCADRLREGACDGGNEPLLLALHALARIG